MHLCKNVLEEIDST